MQRQETTGLSAVAPRAFAKSTQYCRYRRYSVGRFLKVRGEGDA